MRILRGVGSRTLPCGCLIGFYETYDNQTVALVDARGVACGDTAHRVDAAIALELMPPRRAPGSERPLSK